MDIAFCDNFFMLINWIGVEFDVLIVVTVEHGGLDQKFLIIVINDVIICVLPPLILQKEHYGKVFAILNYGSSLTR